MLRIWYPAESVDENRLLRIEGPQAHHLSKVLRVRKGEPVEVLAGGGRLLRGTFVEICGKAAVLAIDEHLQLQSRAVQIVLGIALLKGKAMEQVIRDAVQLGADTIQPLLTERTEVRLDEQRREDKVARWQQLAVESCKQCGNPWLPRIDLPCSLEGWLEGQAGEPAMRLHASLGKEVGLLRDQLPAESLPQRVVWLIGPEGDLAEREYQLAARAGFAGVRLSSQILRAETAVSYALAITEYELSLRGVARGWNYG